MIVELNRYQNISAISQFVLLTRVALLTYHQGIPHKNDFHMAPNDIYKISKISHSRTRKLLL